MVGFWQQECLNEINEGIVILKDTYETNCVNLKSPIIISHIISKNDENKFYLQVFIVLVNHKIIRMSKVIKNLYGLSINGRRREYETCIFINLKYL